MPLNTIHTAIHTIFGATISVGLGLSVHIDKLDQIAAPVGVFTLIILIAVLAECLAYVISVKKPCGPLLFVCVATVIGFGAVTAATFSSKEEIIQILPDAKYAFITSLLFIWVLCMVGLGIAQRLMKR